MFVALCEIARQWVYDEPNVAVERQDRTRDCPPRTAGLGLVEEQPAKGESV